MAQHYRQRGPVLGLIINTKVQNLKPKNVKFLSVLFEKVKIFFRVLFEKVKIFFSVFGHYDSLFLIS